MPEPQRPPFSPPPLPPRVPPAPPPRPGFAGDIPAAQRASATPVATPAAAAQKQSRGLGPSPGHPTLEKLIREANDQGFSDLHLGVG